MPELKVKNHTYSNYDSIQLKHIYLDLKVDFKVKQLSGKAVLDIVNASACKYLILDTKGLEIKKVLLEDSEETPWSLGPLDSLLGTPLVVEIKPQTKKVAVYYHTGENAQALMWLTPEQTSGKKYPFLFTQSQAILARTWVPCMDVPAVRFTYSADIQCDPQFLPLMSASNNFKKNKEGKYHFDMPQAIPSYLLALAVGDIEFKSLGDNCGVFAEPDMLEKSAKEFEELPAMIKEAGKLYGDYAWGRYDVIVLPPSFPFGGMENPRLTFATPTIIAGDKSLVSLVAHELAHSWSGNLVTNQTWDDFWLNEGFTVYFEDRIMEAVYGRDYADMLMELSFGELKLTLNDLMNTAPGDTKLKLKLVNRDPDEAVSDIAYVKGCMFLKMLESKFGRQKFDVFLKGYFDHFKWKTVNTEEFIGYLEENLLKNNPKIQVNYNEWIYNIGLPDNCPKVISKELAKVKEMANKVNLHKSIDAIDTAGFTTQHWMCLLRNLNADSVKGIMSEIDTVYHLTTSTNSEIQCDWYLLSISTDYQTAWPYIQSYLMNVGRRKFLQPIYTRLVQTPEGKAFALKVFEKAGPRYHSVSRTTIDEILNH